MRVTSDLLQPRRKARRPLLVTLAGTLFALLAVLAAVDAVRGTPLPLGGGLTATGIEALLYRCCAALICGALSGFLLLHGSERRADHGGLR